MRLIQWLVLLLVLIPSGVLAVDFDGSNDQVDLGQLGKPANWTLTFWVRPDSHPAEIGLVCQCNSGGNGETIWGVVSQAGGAPGNARQWVSNDSTTQEVDAEAFNSTNYPTTSWTYIAATVDGSNLRYWRNGTLIKTTAQTVTNSGTVYDFRLGVLGESGVWYYNGKMEGVAIHNVALSESDVNCRRFGTNQCPGGLVSHLLLNEGGGSNLTHIDISGNSNNGVGSGGTAGDVEGPPTTWFPFGGN